MEAVIEKAIELETLHEVISNNLVDAVWTVDTKTLTYDYISDSVRNTSGYGANEYIGKTIQKTMSPDTFKYVFKTLSQEILDYKTPGKKIRTIELELIHKSGRFYWVEIKARLLESPRGGLKIIGVTKDITNRKKAEQEKEDAIIRLGKMVSENERLLKENKILNDLLPICSSCKRIRDEKGKWWPLEAYIREHTNADFTHTICTDCTDIFYNF